MQLSYDAASAVSALTAADPVLGQLIRRTGPFAIELRSDASPFQALLRSIVYQQLSGKAAATIYQRLCALFSPRHGPTPRQLLKLGDEQLRGAGLSRAKVVASRDLAAKTLTGTVPANLATLSALSDEEIIERLIAVRGIGRWTVEMLLMFYLGRPDVLPVADLGVRKGFMLTYQLSELPTADALSEHAECWRPYRSVASWYLWRALDSPAAPVQAPTPENT